jgi:hypothetical protein
VIIAASSINAVRLVAARNPRSATNMTRRTIAKSTKKAVRVKDVRHCSNT